MKGYYYQNNGDGIILVPYLFIARTSGSRIRVCLDPNELEELTRAFIYDREIVKENVELGLWKRFEISGKGIEEICSFCSDNRLCEAGEVAVSICREMVRTVKLKE